MNRTYEVMFILRPDLPAEEMDQWVTTLSEAATHAGATLRRSERLGKRRLAYRVEGYQDGEYVLFDLDAPGAAIHEIERRLRVTETVIKYLTVRTDELDKRSARDQQRRSARASRKPAAPAAAPAEIPVVASEAAAE